MLRSREISQVKVFYIFTHVNMTWYTSPTILVEEEGNVRISSAADNAQCYTALL